MGLNQLSATDAAAAIAAGTLTSESLVAACLERIMQREDDVRAWAYVDPELALHQARACDRQQPRSRLHGIPIAFKDVLDTADMPTGYGSPIYRDNRPNCDAACVAQAREAGAVVLGKTVSTEFATRHPNKTRHPRDPAHTPGGSSSGSAAAVADDMVPIAFGTQTSSSIIRPAAYCGVVGYKPSFGLINRAGLKRLSESLDTIGVLTRTVADAALIIEALTGMAPARFERVAELSPRVGLCRTPFWQHADAATHANLESAARTLAACGANVQACDLPEDFSALSDTQITINGYEFSRALSHERMRYPGLISANLSARIKAGRRVSYEQYAAALALAQRCRRVLDDVFRAYDVLIAPSAPGVAPRDLETTGDPIFGAMWTTLHVPCLTLPCGADAAGMPLGVQLVARRGNDAALFLHAEWAARALR